MFRGHRRESSTGRLAHPPHSMRVVRLAPFRQDSACVCWTEDSRGQARKSRNEISSACNAIIYEQYVILYYIDWAHLSGTQRLCTRIP